MRDKLLLADESHKIEGYEVLINKVLPRPIYTQPYLVNNHNDNSREILVQDFNNHLYLIGEDGNLRWNRTLGAPLRSDPVQIDIYHNGKLQYLYLTADRIGLLDRLGRNVPKYPFFLRDTTYLETLSLLDFQDEKYYYLVSNRRGYLYILDNNRQQLAGWRPKRLPYRLSNPAQQVSLGDKNFIIAISQNGKIYAFDKEGVNIAGFPIDLDERISNPLQILYGTNEENTYLTTITDEGKLYRFNLLGEITKEEQLIRPSSQSQFHLCIASEQNEWLIGVSDQDLIRILDKKGQLLFEKEFDSKSSKWELQYFSFSNNLKIIAATDKIGSKTYLYDIRGKSIGKAFPSNKKVIIEYLSNQNRLIIYRTYGKEIGKIALNLQ